MTRLARWLHRNAAISALLLFALTLRAMVPAGHMLDAGTLGIPLKMCSGATWPGPSGGTGSEGGTGNALASHASGCSLAAADLTPLPSTAAWCVISAWPCAARAVPDAPLATPLRVQGRARLPRGPPVLSA